MSDELPSIEPTQPNTQGVRLGKYEVPRKLGEGGMGEVTRTAEALFS